MIFDYISRNDALPFEQRVAHKFTNELQWTPNMIIGIVFSGNITLHYEMHRRTFSTNDLFFFLPMQSFSVIASSEDASILFLTVDQHYIKQLCPQIAQLQLSQNHLSYSLTNPIYISICKDIATIIFNNLKQELCTRMHMLNAATHIITTIFDTYGIVTEKSLRTSQAGTDRSIEIIRYVEDHYAEPVMVTDIANHLGLHPQYFSTYFHKLFGTSFIDYLNTYRVNQSLYDLSYTDDSILNIALKCGFNSHKTYSTAFKKLYQCTPMEYRKNGIHNDNRQVPYDGQIVPEENPTSGTFAFFRQFLAADTDAAGFTLPHTVARQQVGIELDALMLSQKAQQNKTFRALSAGRAFSLLRSEMQEQLRLATKEINLQHLRFRDIFSDDLYVYYETEDHTPVYSWQALDSIFDFILSLCIKPFPEIGYMPSALAAKKQYAGVNYHPNVSVPKSMDAWKNLILSFLTHFVDRYGLAEVESWYFDFWTSPDLQNKDAYWNESKEDFFAFYKATYDAFQYISPSLKLGTPNFSTISGYPWYEDFFQYCFLNHIYPAFVDFHCYGSQANSENLSQDTFLNIHTENFTIKDLNAVEKQLSEIHRIMIQNGFRNLDIIVSDFNLSFFPKDLIRDTCFMGPYICHTITHSLRYAKTLIPWSLSDIHEDAFPESRLFTGGPGLLDYHGIRKASYNALSLIAKLGETVLEIGDNYIFAQSDTRYQLLLYNLAEFDAMFSIVDQTALDEHHRYQIYDADHLFVNLLLHLPKGTYYIKRSEVNRQYGSAYDLWNEMGAPEVLHKEMEDYLRENSVPHVTFSVENVEDSLLLDEDIPPHGVLLLEFIPR